jgi:hypothetical protein
MISFEQLLDKMLELAEIHGDTEDLVRACAELAYKEIAMAAGFPSED